MQTSFHVHGKTCGCSPDVKASGEHDARPRVVIVGAGFGGLSAAKALKHADVRVTLVDRRNHHLFQPLLYQVATAGLSPGQIATPIRTVLRDQKNAEVLLGTVTGVDTARRQVKLGEHEINYDYLVLATGARHSYFGRDEWEQFAPGLKSLEDATELRKRILLAFERAELEEDAAARTRLLTFVVIGAGPTGVEMAGSIAELAHRALASDFRAIDPHAARVVLVEAGPRALSTFPEKLSAYTEKELGKLEVEMMANTKVVGIDATGVMLQGADGVVAALPSACVIWAAGVAASPVAKWLGVDGDRAGRVSVGPDLTVPGHPEIFVIGDCALALGKDGKPVPGLAPVAKQQGEYVGALLKRLQKAPGAARAAFRYRDFGALATIGRKIAIADFGGGVQLRGFIGWLTWSVAHIYFLIGFRNRFSVALDWAWSYLTFERGARLITGPVDAAAAPGRMDGEAAQAKAA
ncbi:MAG TPA: NAD(P)/FAD-dependent oxidoreductase [Hyphomonadaceae bacterium]|nr:NAD(P)/FAD-dependent oxidoreductase [Hyphomonadaceae bacterium]HPN06481.1 NAD(P)/FAD-dependent oxidoreductase [Hyphomonadaceae bacterium]